MKELWQLVDILEADIKVFADFLLKDQCNQTLERAYIKCMFSMLEGILYTFRQEIIGSSQLDNTFTVKEKAKLFEKEYEKKTNSVSNHTKYIPLKDSIKFTLKSFARLRGVNNYKFPANSGWDSMRKAIDVRHRITHPKDINELKISMQDLETAILAKKWFKEDVMGQFI